MPFFWRNECAGDGGSIERFAGNGAAGLAIGKGLAVSHIRLGGLPCRLTGGCAPNRFITQHWNSARTGERRFWKSLAQRTKACGGKLSRCWKMKNWLETFWKFPRWKIWRGWCRGEVRRKRTATRSELPELRSPIIGR